MKYLSVCSGIEAASVAWHPLGWEPVAFSEIDPFASQVLNQRFPNVPNLGDMNKYAEWELPAFDLLVGGTPCQSFSVAGLRKGLDDPRGNLSLVYLGILDRFRPRWCVWENVPGVLQSSGGRDFGAFLGGLAQLGYGFSYRVLDAQYVRVESHPRAVPQRRRRVFVVGHSGGDWRRAAEVLLEPEGVRGNPPTRRKAGEAATGAATRGTRSSVEVAGPLGGAAQPSIAFKASHYTRGKDGAPSVVVPPLSADADRGDQDTLVAAVSTGRGYWNESEVGATLRAQESATKADTLIAAPTMAVRRLTPLECERLQGFPDDYKDNASSAAIVETYPIQDCREITKKQNGLGISNAGDPAYTIDTTGAQGVYHKMRVRRLTPRECERLQGFPDEWTVVTYRGKPAADGHRYKALGNSMAVNVMRFIGERIHRYEAGEL